MLVTSEDTRTASASDEASAWQRRVCFACTDFRARSSKARWKAEQIFPRNATGRVAASFEISLVEAVIHKAGAAGATCLYREKFTSVVHLSRITQCSNKLVWIITSIHGNPKPEATTHFSCLRFLSDSEEEALSLIISCSSTPLTTSLESST